MVAWRRFLGPFRTNTINDLHAGIMTLKTATFDRRLFDTDMSVGSSQAGGDPSAAQPSGKPYKKNTIHDLIGLLKRFYRWMAESNFSEIDPKKIRAIKIPGKDRMTKTVDMIITPDEVEAIIRACESPRDRALFGMLWDGGFRAVEVGTLTWEQIRFVECGAVVNVDAKTEFPRYVRLLCSSANLTQWHDRLSLRDQRQRARVSDPPAPVGDVRRPRRPAREAGQEGRDLEAADPSLLPPRSHDGYAPAQDPRPPSRRRSNAWRQSSGSPAGHSSRPSPRW